MTGKQPKAMRIADALNELDAQFSFPGLCGDAAAELRRLHELHVLYQDNVQRLNKLCYDYLGELTALRAVKQMQEQKLRFKCTVVDDQHQTGVPLDQWGNAAQRQWVGLTRNEAMEIINSLAGHDWRYVIDAIEAKLREKNTGEPK